LHGVPKPAAGALATHANVGVASTGQHVCPEEQAPRGSPRHELFVSGAPLLLQAAP
jgi:hypothetical protein